MPKIDISRLPVDTATNYPDPFWKQIVGRERKRLGNAAGLTQFGVNLTTLKPGAWSSQRHWHENEDEFIYVLAGEIVLCEDEGETVLKPGDCFGFGLKSSEVRRIGIRPRGDDLQSHFAVQVFIAGQVNDSHPAATQRPATEDRLF